LELGNVHVTVTSSTNAEVGWLRNYLTFEDTANAFVARRGRRAKRVSPPKIPLYDVVEGRFLSGLLPLVSRRAREAGHEVAVVDARPPGLVADPGAYLSWLRPHQRPMVDAVVRHERGILRAGTGAGKTEVFIGLTRALPGAWTFVAHRRELAEQAARRYDLRQQEMRESLGEAEGAIQRLGGGYEAARFFGRNATIGERLTVTTFATLRSRLATVDGRRLVSGTHGLVLDECHVAPSNTHMEVSLAFVNARHRIGLSGTPLDREDQRSLMAVGVLGPIIHDLPAKVLVDAGVLARPDIMMVPCHQTINKRTYKGIYGEGVVRSVKRNALLVRATLHAKKPSIVYVRVIEHGKRLVEQLVEAGLKAELVWGGSSPAERDRARDRLRSGDLDVVVANVVWQEGIDVPEIESIGVACGEKSVISTIQRMGRGLRATDVKKSVEIWDIADLGQPTLERHARKRRRSYEREGYHVQDFDPDQLSLWSSAQSEGGGSR
jgi:superfamily II DNA or RNA helicase